MSEPRIGMMTRIPRNVSFWKNVVGVIWCLNHGFEADSSATNFTENVIFGKTWWELSIIQYPAFSNQHQMLRLSTWSFMK